jgi:hypothetical protein
MFDEVGRAEMIARFDELFERHYPSKTAESAGLIESIGAPSRVENRAAAAQLVAIGQLFSNPVGGTRITAVQSVFGNRPLA